MKTIVRTKLKLLLHFSKNLVSL